MSGNVVRCLTAMVLAGLAAPVAHAKDAAAPKSIWEQDTLTGDWGGTRTALKDRGIDISLTYINEVLGVVSGGLNRRGSYEGRLDLSTDFDLDKLLGWKGASAHFTVFQIHSTSRNAAQNVGSIADPSNIDALQTTRLFTLWFQQNWWDDKLSLRVGQLAADDEFLTSPTATGLINGTFGWASIHGANMLNGGPAYPLAAPGARLAVKPTDEITLQTAVFAGDPSGGNCADLPQVCNRYGLEFSLAGGPLWITELQYGLNQAKDAKGMPAIYKIGFWYHDHPYADILAPFNHSNNWGVYGVVDQMVWRSETSSVSFFVRAGAVPSDRNLVSYYVDGGIGIKGIVAGRPDDTLTFGVAYQNISDDIATADTLAGLVPQDHEVVFELSYMAQLAPWWTLQPDLQYIVHPNGGQNAITPTTTVGDAFVVGLRSTMKF